MSKRRIWLLALIAVLWGLSALALVNENIVLALPGGSVVDRPGLRLGLDLKGGSHLVYEADLTGIPTAERESLMEAAATTIERRINAFGVAEPIIQRQGPSRISVQLPGVRDINRAIVLIGQTAQLEFWEPFLNPDGSASFTNEGLPMFIRVAEGLGKDGQPKKLTGALLKHNTAVVFDSTTNQPQVSFEFDEEGALIFRQVTSRLISKPLGIILDGQLISAPTIRAVISSRGVIEGLTLEEARSLSIQLNSGRLPVPLTIVEREDVDPTLGEDSIRKSLVAGGIGLGIVLLFMIIYYRLPGLLASLALVMYAMVLLAIFKMMPVTLTLAGIAAFILSIGMAVDANILIFERMKEELWGGRTLGAAIETGFNRAWSSIRDSNLSTIITCVILYWFGNNFGETRLMGFALTLFIGVLLSMFTAITVTRTFLRLFVGTGMARRLGLFTAQGARSGSATSQGSA